ncbi:aminoglycoside 3-N-acetyltransferase [Nonomuraea polychroma]|uniref:Aminoglycoside N(3)-acetyltransferase n=1 Tax=Nonomuraea polychroma TaxID=46176 RepID=A0A438LX11_9ACTN|nr:AAC(3) family N-acetyltransferase [Nonomuraea polychroma]RVX38040.1 aminoglycoside 3-N-acetyltransferase [Nonomuraea polychroma]
MLDVDRLARDFAALGVGFGQVVLLHSSLKSLGRSECGAGTVVAALRKVLGGDGTLVVPAGTSGNSDTSPLYRAAVAGMTPDEAAAYRSRMPAFDPATTPSHQMGQIAEHVRTLPGALRSAHPHTSFAAMGSRAAEIIEGHDRDCLLGERSPLARLYDAGALVLLLGVGYDKCTAFHLAEYRYTASPPRRRYRAVVDDGNGRTWCEFEDVAVDASDFAALGADFDETGVVRRGRVGAAEARLFSLPAAVAYAVDWLASHRDAPAGG